MIFEHVEHRALAAIRFLDEETHLPVRTLVKVEGPGVRLVRNLSGLHVVVDAPGFTEYASKMALPAIPPAPATLTLTATDPSRTYLPCRFTVDLPRDPLPAPVLPDDSIFLTRDVMLYPSAIARANAGSAVVRLRVTDKNGAPLPNALVQLSLAAPALQRRGLADERGEALVLIPGIPIANWTDPQAPTSFDLTVKASWSGDAPPPNPETLAAALQDVTGTIQAAAGREVFKEISLSWIEL